MAKTSQPDSIRETTLKEYLEATLHPEHRARVCFDDLEFFCRQIFNGLDTKMLTFDTPADETLENNLRRGRRALKGLEL